MTLLSLILVFIMTVLALYNGAKPPELAAVGTIEQIEKRSAAADAVHSDFILFILESIFRIPSPYIELHGISQAVSDMFDRLAFIGDVPVIKILSAVPDELYKSFLVERHTAKSLIHTY